MADASASRPLIPHPRAPVCYPRDPGRAVGHHSHPLDLPRGNPTRRGREFVPADPAQAPGPSAPTATSGGGGGAPAPATSRLWRSRTLGDEPCGSSDSFGNRSIDHCGPSMLSPSNLFLRPNVSSSGLCFESLAERVPSSGGLSPPPPHLTKRSLLAVPSASHLPRAAGQFGASIRG